MKRPRSNQFKILPNGIMGYTISVAVKMTGLAKPNRFVIGQLVYDALDENKSQHSMY